VSDEDIFDQIRHAAAAVTGQARFVHLVDDAIAPYATSLAGSDRLRPTYDDAHHFKGPEADTVSYTLTLDSVNFGSGYFPHLRKRPGMSGYFTVASSLRDRWRQDGPLSGAELRNVRPEDCARLFGQVDNAGPAQQLMALFARAFNDLGEWLGRCYDDDPLAAIADAGGSAARLVALVAEMPFYRDVSSLDGMEVPFYKRAQIVASDLSIAFDRLGPGAFADLDRLTIFADNLVPHVLRVDGVLAYDPALLARIERGEVIAAGSREEIEIRAVALHVVERIAAELAATGSPATAQQLDYLLWNRGLGSAYKAIPRHRTRTVFY
jgi:hypothetical protein